MTTADKIVDTLWSQLDERQRKILAGRFGLADYKEAQTLASLGKTYGITRERVRQIEANGLQLLKEKAASHPAVSEFVERSRKYLKNAGGVARKDEFLLHHRLFIADMEESHLNFLSEASSAFLFHPEDDEFWAFFYLDAKNLSDVIHFIVEWTDFLRAKKEEIISSSNYRQHFKIFVGKRGFAPGHAERWIMISKKFYVNPYGDLGLTEWPEIRPTTIRDHVYLILKKEQEPLHFTIITDRINEKKTEGRRALRATVHNELIKDPRFVLVGRGIYGLSEHGYRSGTAREVIRRILKESGPMRTKHIISAVQKERFFKPNTVLVNLQNKRFFSRRPDGTYQSRK